MKFRSDEPITVPSLSIRKSTQIKITALTAYDATMARLIDDSGVDLILVGDSVASVIQGESTTLPVTLDHMVYHCRCVTRGVSHALVVGDLPFMSYQASVEDGMRAAGRLLKEGGVGAVKLEGGTAVVPLIERMHEFDIPVMGHVGLTPQSYHRMGGHKVQGRTHASNGSKRTPGSWEKVLEDAKAVERAGAFAVVLEAIPAELAAEITSQLSIPTIGIGAGPDCDGQILVSYDMLGLTSSQPKFVKPYANVAGVIQAALHTYVAEVQQGIFPAKKHTFKAGSNQPAPVSH